MVPVAGPQPMFALPGNGTQSTNGTSQAFWPLSTPPTSRVQDEFAQSMLVWQNWKQRGKQPSSMQTYPGRQLSVC